MSSIHLRHGEGKRVKEDIIDSRAEPPEIGRRHVVIGFTTAIAGLSTIPLWMPGQKALAASTIPYRWPFDTLRLPDPRQGQQWDASREGGRRRHAGADLNVGDSGARMYSIASGVVVRGVYTQQPSGSQEFVFGNMITIKNDDGVFATYAHMQGPPLVRPGVRVALGQHIGYLGSTGTSTPHLHLEMRTGDNGGSFQVQDDFDPVPYINSRLGVPKPLPVIAASSEEDEEDMYIRRADTGAVAVFGGGFRSDGGTAGRHQFGSEAEYQKWRIVLNAYNSNIDRTGGDARGKRFVPPANLADVMAVDEPTWAVVCGLWGV
ncbi:M23 family metallopeptidase [Clavibacter capsici]|uniref:M23 family metallopeptidase n=1 Tax=Clavibacter capsici TaxID=1874630 RepID=UPI001427F447|nr:M23 family metallopeptidase [Clavibacter capsici]QIS38832.1 M23 family metallopeptidase [Clavibacter capsici]